MGRLIGLVIGLVIGVVICCALPQSSSGGQHSVDQTNKICCPGDIIRNIRIPHKRLESYFWTSSVCSVKHIVIVTTAGKPFCMSPEYQLVQQYINHIDKQRASKSPK